ncbi:MAG: hypothetical protein HY716_04160 [Planctomycetes bacterium]|nr:hypothetical protein [Planctomycetota bacterium]
MADRVVLSVGTKRGLFVFESSAKRDRWTSSGPYLKGWPIYHAIVDARNGARIHAAGCSDVFATNTFSADLRVRKFTGAKRPPVPPKPRASHLKFARKYGISMTPRIWHIEPGRSSERGVLYAGTAPAALFRSTDHGRTWEEIKSITNHPTRKHWMPGAGGMCLHSIQLDPGNPKRMWVAVSAAGSFRTDDGGRTWAPINKAVAKYVGAPKEGETGT